MSDREKPIRIEVGLSQLVIRSPAALPTGTRPAAIAPMAVPSMNGVTIEATANIRSICAAHGPGGGRAACSRAAEDDADRGDEERRSRGSRTASRKHAGSGPQDGDHQDQPHVVGLPHGCHCVVAEVADPLAPFAAAAHQLPEAGAEVGAGQHRVEDQTDEHDHHREGRASGGLKGRVGRRVCAGEGSGERASRHSVHATPRDDEVRGENGVAEGIPSRR